MMISISIIQLIKKVSGMKRNSRAQILGCSFSSFRKENLVCLNFSSLAAVSRRDKFDDAKKEVKKLSGAFKEK